MKKINISLVGGQPMPVYVGIEATNPDIIILVHSPGEKGSQPEAEIIKQHYGKKSVLYPLPPVDYPQACNNAEALLNQYQDAEVMVNISSGTKPWTVAFALLSANRPNVQLFYIDQNNRMHNLTKKTVEDIVQPYNIETLLNYNNQYGFIYKKFSSYTADDLRVLHQLNELRRFNYRDFKNLTDPAKNPSLFHESKSSDSPLTTLKSGSSIIYLHADHKICIKLYNRFGRKKEAVLSSPNMEEIMKNAGWFELEVAEALNNWQYAKEVWLNTKFPYKNGTAKNEIDIIVNVDHKKLLFVECKTNIFNNTDIDKFRTAVKNYGGMGSKSLFVTNMPELQTETQQKCEESRIMTFCMSTKLAGRQVSRSPKELYELLEKEILNINTR